MGHSADAWLYFLQGQLQENGGWSLGDAPKYTWRVEESKEEEKTVAQEVMEAREFVRETTRNAWVPDDMKRKIEKHITKLCNAIESQKMHIESIANEHLKMRFEWCVQSELLSKVKELKMGFERINTTQTMSELTRQCIEAYNTCSEIQRKLLEMDKPKTKGKTE